MLTSAGANNLRSNMPLYKFINMFPNIPKYCQKHINQIIELIHKGQLKVKILLQESQKDVLYLTSLNINIQEKTLWQLKKDITKNS